MFLSKEVLERWSSPVPAGIILMKVVSDMGARPRFVECAAVLINQTQQFLPGKGVLRHFCNVPVF
jgi:hypothetical protein